MDFPLPPVGEGLIEVELGRWLVAPGDAVARGQLLAEVTSDKAAMELPAPFAGTVTELLGEPGDKLLVGATILRYEPEGASVAPTPVSPPARVAAAPSVRRLARDLGVDLAAVHGSGPDGRVLIGDVRPGAPPAPTVAAATPTRVKLAGVRKVIAERMVRAKRAPHFTYVDEFDLGELVRLRAQLKAPFARAGRKLTYLPFVVKAVARALGEFPGVNATFDDAGELATHVEINIGVAVAAPAGLVVPVVRDARSLDVAGISGEIERLSGAARAGKVARADLLGGTFTVSSIGNVGGLIATPILNAPEVGIVAVGKIVRKPVYDDRGRVVPADLAFFSFAFDHRVIDGAVAAGFGNAVARHLAAPATLLLPDEFAA